MSNAIFPTLTALAWDRAKIPTWSTNARSAVSGKEIRTALWSYPRWDFSLSYEVLDNSVGLNSDLQNIMGFFNLRMGSYDDFLFEDVTDNTATGVTIGVANGVTKTFQLVRNMGSGANLWVEPMKNIKGVPTIYVNGVAQSVGLYTISNGLVTFTTAPTSGTVTATFNFYYRVRFTDDASEYNQFMYNLYELKKMDFRGVK